MKKNNKINDVFVLVQVILAIATVSFSVMSLYVEELRTLMELFFALLMFVMAYNNKVGIKRKGFSIIYIIIGIIFLSAAIIGACV